MMNRYKFLLWNLVVMLVIATSCGKEDEPESTYSYYLNIQSKVELNLSDDDENQGTMVDPTYDLLSNTVSRMRKALREIEANRITSEPNDADVITACDSLYRSYVSHFPENKGVIICTVKLVRTKMINHVAQEEKDIKTYFFWMPSNDNPDEQGQPASLKVPDCLEAIDLGLSVLWSNCNMGASSPSDYGGYFAWGDTTGTLCSATGIRANEESYTSWNTENYGGITPPSEISGTNLDIVAVHWKNGWRMPSYTESLELCEKCQWVLHEGENGIKWYEVIGPSGKSIIMPLTGVYGDNIYKSPRFMDGPINTNVSGYYWTSTISPTLASAEERGYGVNDGIKTAWAMICRSNYSDSTGYYRFVDQLRAFHMSIRPVHNK